MTKPIKGWWFSSDNTLPHGDGRKIVIGRTHKVEGEIIPCKNGLHMSVKPLDALQYAPGPIVWRVVGGGTVVPDGDKFACSERTPIAGGFDCSSTLRKSACLCALDVIHLWDAPDIVVRYLKTQDESLRDAVGDVASRAAWAAGNAAWAAGAASSDILCAWDAARAAALAAAWSARAAGTARAAARDNQNRRLTRMLNKAIREHEREG